MIMPSAMGKLTQQLPAKYDLILDSEGGLIFVEDGGKPTAAGIYTLTFPLASSFSISFLIYASCVNSLITKLEYILLVF
jgi:hypothetical protein